MPYDVDKDSYLNKTNNVLQNLLNIQSQRELDDAEAQISSIKISELLINCPFDISNFDARLLCKIHKHIFSDIYSWAGNFRTIDLEKGTTRFAHSEHISSQINILLDELKSENNLENINRDEFIHRFAHYFSELNVIHPFREGNGRTLRTFFSLIAMNSGYSVNWNDMKELENINACISGYNGDEKPLCDMLDRLISVINI